MEIEFQHQNIALRVCMVIPLWFILAFIEYFFWGDTINPFLFILISAIIMAFLAPILFKTVYGTFSFLIFHTGKACFFDETIVFVFNKRTKTIDKSTVSNELLPVKRTVKKYKVFPASSLCAAGRFLCSEIQLVLLHRRQHAQVALYSPGVVVVDIVLNHLDKFFLTGKSSAVVTLPL